MDQIIAFIADGPKEVGSVSQKFAPRFNKVVRDSPSTPQDRERRNDGSFKKWLIACGFDVGPVFNRNQALVQPWGSAYTAAKRRNSTSPVAAHRAGYSYVRSFAGRSKGLHGRTRRQRSGRHVKVRPSPLAPLPHAFYGVPDEEYVVEEIVAFLADGPQEVACISSRFGAQFNDVVRSNFATPIPPDRRNDGSFKKWLIACGFNVGPVYDRNRALVYPPGEEPGDDEEEPGGKPHASQHAKASQSKLVRLAAAFAGTASLYTKANVFGKDVFMKAWQSFCKDSGEEVCGFKKVLNFLMRWRVLVMNQGRLRLAATPGAKPMLALPPALSGALVGGRPPAAVVKLVNPAPLYPLPADLARLKCMERKKMQRALVAAMQERGLEAGVLTMDNFSEYHHTALFAEEMQRSYDILLYDLNVDSAMPREDSGLFTVEVPGLLEKRPSVLRGDAVLLTCSQGRFVGYVHRVLRESVLVSFSSEFANRPPFSLHFEFNRGPLRFMHRAIDDCPELFTAEDPILRPIAEPHDQLNHAQREFLSAASAAGGENCANLPLLLWGPPGTGKTTTLVHTIQSILKRDSQARVLATAPSNRAADILCERLAALGVRRMLRLVAVMRDPRDISPAVRSYTKLDEHGGFTVPALEELHRYDVVVATCTTCAYMRSRVPVGVQPWFTHVFVDEAAQALDAETRIPLSMRSETGRIFLAGDFRQLGPIVRSPVAQAYGLGVSLMERIVNRIGVKHSRVFTLTDTYRAHPSILKLYNDVIYAGMLRCRSPASCWDFEAWPECARDPEGMTHPVIFHNCDGVDERSEDSPSWMNLSEQKVVKSYLDTLLARDVDPTDIGVITPYHKQRRHLRAMCSNAAEGIEVGTIEYFQGLEKRVIIVSTVRSRQQSGITNDLKCALGFLGNCQRTNVALSRTKSLLILVGNLSLLSTDEKWNQIIRLVRDMGGIRGTPFDLQPPRIAENGARRERDHLQALVAEEDRGNDSQDEWIVLPSSEKRWADAL